jgi:hypothetical protein
VLFILICWDLWFHLWHASYRSDRRCTVMPKWEEHRSVSKTKKLQLLWRNNLCGFCFFWSETLVPLIIWRNNWQSETCLAIHDLKKQWWVYYWSSGPLKKQYVQYVLRCCNFFLFQLICAALFTRGATLQFSHWSYSQISYGVLYFLW